jgi:hypothetical protein
MNAKLGWGLAALALALGHYFFGWRGVALAGSGMVFWLLLQFSRALRAMRAASGAPVGTVPSAVMLNARLHLGMRLMNILMITRSLGEKLADSPETYRWHDAAGDSVQVVLRAARCSEWTLTRAAAADTSAPAPASA